MWLVPYLVHELLLLSPSSNYPLLYCYHNLCAVNYTSTHVLAPKYKTGRLSTAALCRGLEYNRMVGAQHGRCMASANGP